MRRTIPGFASRAAPVALLIVAWVLVWLDYNSVVARTGYENIPNEVLLAGFAMCAYGGALVRILAPGHPRPWAGAVAGIVMIVSYIVGAVVIQAINGLLGGGLPEGETEYSMLIELPFWLGVPFGLGALLGFLGWVAAGVLGGPTPSHPHRG